MARTSRPSTAGRDDAEPRERRRPPASGRSRLDRKPGRCIVLPFVSGAGAGPPTSAPPRSFHRSFGEDDLLPQEIAVNFGTAVTTLVFDKVLKVDDESGRSRGRNGSRRRDGAMCGPRASGARSMHPVNDRPGLKRPFDATGGLFGRGSNGAIRAVRSIVEGDRRGIDPRRDRDRCGPTSAARPAPASGRAGWIALAHVLIDRRRSVVSGPVPANRRPAASRPPPDDRRDIP